MPSNRHIMLFHSPQPRSTAALLLLDELQADCELHLLNMKAGLAVRHAAAARVVA